MAKGGKKSSTSHTKTTRDATTPSLDPLSALVNLTPVADMVLSRPPPTPIQQTDRRKYNPTRSVSPPGNRLASRIVSNVNQARSTYLRTRLLTNSPLKYGRRKFGISTVKERLSFNLPKRLEMCLRRKVRSEVMHAKKKTGKGGQKRPVRNFWSRISCK